MNTTNTTTAEAVALAVTREARSPCSRMRAQRRNRNERWQGLMVRLFVDGNK